MKLNPNKDGIDHINVYSGSRTELGKMLSNFYHFEIETKDGKFQSVEAYWFWLGISDKCSEREKLRTLYGYDAKKLGTELREYFPAEQKVADFEDRIIRAIWYKVQRNIRFFTEEYENLPLQHYYVLPSGKIKNVYKQYAFMIEAEEKMKRYIYKQYKKR